MKRIGGKILSRTSRNKLQYKFSIAEEGISDLEYILKIIKIHIEG